MRNFYTKNTVEAPNFCRKCNRETQWAISGGRPMHCIPCYSAQQNPTIPGIVKPAPEQLEMFDEGK